MTTLDPALLPKIKCSKLQCFDHVYKCATHPSCECGCESNINISSINDILHNIQKSTQEEYIMKIADSVKAKNAALVLGAGVSIPANMPNWVGLVSKMIGYSMQYDRVGALFVENPDEGDVNIRKTALSKALIHGDLKFLRGVNTLESAEYVSQTFDDVTLPREIRDRLPEASIKAMVHSMVNDSKKPHAILSDYCSAHPDSSIVRSLPEAIREQIESKSLVGENLFQEIKNYLSEGMQKAIAETNTISAVSYLLSRSNGIHTAMTYNYDPLVQEQMIELFGMEPQKIVTHSGKWNSTNEETTEIFHVHGFVPGDRHRKMANDDENFLSVFPATSERLILSEDSYHEIEENGVYNWSSTIQSHFLNKYNCIFVGFSAEDYNFKRILRQLGPVPEAIEPCRPWHYLILTVGDFIKQTYEDVCRYYVNQYKNGMPENAVEEIAADCEVLIQYTLECKKKYWHRYHIHPIWVGVEDIPQLLLRFLP